MRNPWGHETYHGPYSDSADEWSADLIDEAGHIISNEGIFFMPIENYHQEVETTFVSRDNTNWYQSYFLMLDDTTSTDGQFSQCGSNCTRHQLTLTSDVRQTVWLTAHTWD